MTFMDRLNTGTVNDIWVNGGPFSDEVRRPRQTGLPNIEVMSVAAVWSTGRMPTLTSGVYPNLGNNRGRGCE